VRHGGFEAKYPDAKGYVAASLPGYTRDGRTAYVSFFSGPGGIHGGPSGEFLFAYREGRWTLIWRRMSQAM
jgi:hypothetical protein